jgi:hypothetical protein
MSEDQARFNEYEQNISADYCSACEPSPGKVVPVDRDGFCLACGRTVMARSAERIFPPEEKHMRSPDEVRARLADRKEKDRNDNNPRNWELWEALVSELKWVLNEQPEGEKDAHNRRAKGNEKDMRPEDE